MSDSVYIIGIDLGTTNSVAAYAHTQDKGQSLSEIFIFDMPRLVEAGVITRDKVLPSVIYIPTEHEAEGGVLSLPWNEKNRLVVGEYARQRGTEAPQRLIASAKSWLCNTMIDRNKPVLPWNSPGDIPHLSPVEASAVFLRYMRDSWNHLMAAEDDRLRLENQEVFLTVPASFDAVARDLTVKAAERVGLSRITLLEEPQAAFYSWIASSKNDSWRRQIKKGDLVLVCDVGGGTTDFSLIRVSERRGELDLERIAVGNHLLVGGDNMDLALAHHLARKMAEDGIRLDSWQMRSLVQACRSAKEKVFCDLQTDQIPVTILGRGSRLIGGAIRTALTRKEVEELILDGFFPECALEEKPKNLRKLGLQEAGLSYESDPGVTRHLAEFLSRQKKAGDLAMELPTAVLFNGGVMSPEPVRKRVLDVINSWRLERGVLPVREIPAGEFDLSVARGAVYYGLARRGGGIRIRGGLGKSYYTGVAAAMPAVPGLPPPVKALCVAPFGMEEGSSAHLKTQEFVLALGEPVQFNFFGSSTRKADAVGDIIEDWEGGIEEITTMETTLDGPQGGMIRVTIEIQVTEVGTLELWCVSTENGQRWKLEFNVREQG